MYSRHVVLGRALGCFPVDVAGRTCLVNLLVHFGHMHGRRKDFFEGGWK